MMRINRREFGVSILGVLGRTAAAQESPDMLIDRVATGFRFTEGPAWSREGFLLFSDVPNDKIMKYVPGQKPTVFRDNSNGANGNCFDAQGRFYTCESRTRRVVRVDKKGEMQVLAEEWEGKRFNAPNDIVVRKDGHIYFTDPAFGNQADTREMEFYGVYHITPKSELSLIANPAGRPNGSTFGTNDTLATGAHSSKPNDTRYSPNMTPEA